MNVATIQLILALLPIAEKMMIVIGDKVSELNTEGITVEDVKAVLLEHKEQGFPHLEFKSSKEN